MPLNLFFSIAPCSHSVIPINFRPIVAFCNNINRCLTLPTGWENPEFIQSAMFAYNTAKTSGDQRKCRIKCVVTASQWGAEQCTPSKYNGRGVSYTRWMGWKEVILSCHATIQSNIHFHIFLAAVIVIIIVSIHTEPFTTAHATYYVTKPTALSTHSIR